MDHRPERQRPRRERAHDARPDPSSAPPSSDQGATERMRKSLGIKKKVLILTMEYYRHAPRPSFRGDTRKDEGARCPPVPDRGTLRSLQHIGPVPHPLDAPRHGLE